MVGGRYKALQGKFFTEETLENQKSSELNKIASRSVVQEFQRRQGCWKMLRISLDCLGIYFGLFPYSGTVFAPFFFQREIFSIKRYGYKLCKFFGEKNKKTINFLIS